MEIHGRPSILTSLQGVNKLFGDGLAKNDVVAAAAPEPAVTAWEGETKEPGCSRVEPDLDLLSICCAFTSLSIPAVIAAAVVKVSQTAVPG